MNKKRTQFIKSLHMKICSKIMLARIVICDESPPKMHLRQRFSLAIGKVTFHAFEALHYSDLAWFSGVSYHSEIDCLFTSLYQRTRSKHLRSPLHTSMAGLQLGAVDLTWFCQCNFKSLIKYHSFHVSLQWGCTDTSQTWTWYLVA